MTTPADGGRTDGASGMPTRVTVALDLLGGDTGPEVVADAALLVHEQQPGIDLILVGPADLAAELIDARGLTGHVRVLTATSSVRMDEDPVRAVRTRPEVSVQVAAAAVRSGQAHACVSIGHTGASLAAATLTLGRLPGISRAAVAVVVPATHHPVVLLDVGGTVDATPELLSQFALAGSAFAAALGLADEPSVGLLTIGSEPGKGDALRRLTHEVLLDLPLRYVGPVEGDHVAVGGRADVIVTDGFTGNVVLKALEGAAQNTAERIAARSVDPEPALEVARSFAIGTHAGAVLLGINGVSVVGHGASTSAEIAAYVALAARSVRSDLVPRTAEKLRSLIDPAVAR